MIDAIIKPLIDQDSGDTSSSGGSFTRKRHASSQLKRMDAYADNLPPSSGTKLIQGLRPRNEDAMASVPEFFTSRAAGQYHYYGVFDGHGGGEVSEYCSSYLHTHLLDHLTNAGSSSASKFENTASAFASTASTAPSSESPSPPPPTTTAAAAAPSAAAAAAVAAAPPRCGYCKACHDDEKQALVRALTEAFLASDAAVAASVSNVASCGSTACAAVVTDTAVVVANCGDSRAVLVRGGQVIPISSDHRPHRQDEVDRVLAKGGQILWNSGARVMGILGCTRSIGDRDLQPYGISPIPEVFNVARSADDEFLMLATDGVWNVLDSDTVCGMVQRCLKRAADKNATRASAFRMAADVAGRMAKDKGSKDDIAVVLVDLVPPPLTQQAWHVGPAARFASCSEYRAAAAAEGSGAAAAAGGADAFGQREAVYECEDAQSEDASQSGISIGVDGGGAPVTRRRLLMCYSGSSNASGGGYDGAGEDGAERRLSAAAALSPAASGEAASCESLHNTHASPSSSLLSPLSVLSRPLSYLLSPPPLLSHQSLPNPHLLCVSSNATTAATHEDMVTCGCAEGYNPAQRVDSSTSSIGSASSQVCCFNQLTIGEPNGCDLSASVEAAAVGAKAEGQATERETAEGEAAGLGTAAVGAAGVNPAALLQRFHSSLRILLQLKLGAEAALKPRVKQQQHQAKPPPLLQRSQSTSRVGACGGGGGGGRMAKSTCDL